MESIDLTEKLLQSVDIGKVFKDTSEITSLSFSSDGRYLLSGSSSINFYDVLKSTHEKNIPSFSSNIHFTNHPNGFLSSSLTSLEYWNLPQSQIIHSYPISEITSIDMNPINDLCICSARKQFSIIDLNTKDTIALLELPESTGDIICKYDCYGLIFVVAYPVINNGRYKNIIQLFDSKDFSRGAFALWSFEGPEIISLDFSFDGQYLLVNTTSNQIFLLDSIDGKIKNVYKDHLGNIKCPAVFSPDSRYFFTVCDKTCNIIAVNTENNQKVSEFKGNFKPVKTLAWSPEHCLFASGNDHLLFWAPDFIRNR